MKAILTAIFSLVCIACEAFYFGDTPVALQKASENSTTAETYGAVDNCYVISNGLVVRVVNSIIVKPNPEKTTDIINYISSKYDAVFEPIEQFDNWLKITIKDVNAERILKLADELYTSGLAAHSEPDLISSRPEGYQVTYDPYSSSQWHIYNDSYPGIDTNVLNAWNYNTGYRESPDFAAEPIHVGIIDCEIDFTIPDLINQVCDSVLTGKVPTQFIGYENIPEVTHGTNMAGIILAQRNNNIGIAGIAPMAKLNFRTVNYKTSTASEYAIAIKELADEYCSIINCSFSVAYSNIINEAIAYATKKGCLIVAAAGDQTSGNAFYPAAHQDVLSVGSIGKNGEISNFSNYGNNVDIVAPGEKIITTNPRGDITFISGTSAAAACVTGCAALVKGYNHTLTPTQIKAILSQTANRDILPCSSWYTSSAKPYGRYNTRYGYGLVDAYQAILQADKLLKNTSIKR